MKNLPSHWRRTRWIYLGIALVSLPVLQAQEQKANPTGTWTWSFTTQNGDVIKSKVQIKKEGEKLAGTFTGRNATEVPVKDIALKGDELSFTVVRERNDQKFTANYSGKISGDTIKGKVEFDFNGQTRSRDWEAKREAGARNLTGTWKYSFTTQDGQTLEPKFRIKQDGDKLTGVVIFGENEREISEGKVKDGQIAFQVVRERDGRTVTSKYVGKLEGDSIKGKITSNWSGEDRTYSFEAKRAAE